MSNLVNDEMRERVKLLNNVKQSKLYTYSLEVTSACENHITVEGVECINLISNNYLGFATHPKILEKVQSTLVRYGLGIGGSPMACGITDIHIALMERIANVYQQEAAVLFTTGYQALLGSVQAAVKKGDVALLDNLVHRSIVDGVTLSGCDKRMWMHNDYEDLEDLLQRIEKKYERKIIIVDSVYSMDGDMADLAELKRIGDKYGAIVLIDEAHSLGVLGKKGYGLPDHFNIYDGADITSGTFSKFAGAIGGFAAGKREYIDYLKSVSSAYIFSASLPPEICAGILQAFDLLDEEPQWLQKLWDNVTFFHKGLRDLGFDIGKTVTPVVPLMIRDIEKTLLFNRKILDNGIYSSPMVYPSVAPAESRIRIGVIATHTRNDLEKCLDVFGKTGRELGII